MTATPGPWKASTIPGDSSKWEVRDSKGKSITGWGRVTQTRENARLIAAAPEMKKRVEELEDTLDRLLDGLEANYDERCGLTSDEWEQRINDAHKVLKGDQP